VPATVTITVYTVSGEVVTRLRPEFFSEGVHEELWDNKNESGQPVASGVFIYKIQAESQRGELKSGFGKCAVSR
jgi:flagellar hook assembly protein FlgD